MKILILLIMLFLHIVDDYYLQGVLANMKMKEWWDKQTDNPLYKNDYKMALIEHAFSWTFVMMSPIMVLMIYNNDYRRLIPYLLFLIENTIVHAIIDNLKANKRSINLVIDQTSHFIQIVSTWFGLILFY